MKLPSTIKDKLGAALGLGLVCGLALPLEPTAAKSKKVKPVQAKPAQKKSGSETAKARPLESDKNANPKTVEAPEAEQTPKKTEDLCPACGRG